MSIGETKDYVTICREGYKRLLSHLKALCLPDTLVGKFDSFNMYHDDGSERNEET